MDGVGSFGIEMEHADMRPVAAEVNSLYEKLLEECDKVTGRRRI